MPIGIICAMEEEISLLKADIQSSHMDEIAGREFYSGSLYGKEVVLVMSRIGKVATAITTTLLIERFGVDRIIFAGTAGGVDPVLHVGDVVVADRSVQHDFSANPGEFFRIPLINKSYFDSDPTLTRAASEAATEYFSVHLDVPDDVLKQFGIKTPSVLTGTIASGDQFICDNEKHRWLYEQVENIKCVEMEGAAMAQVCYEYQIPYTIIRVVSDSADNDAGFSFMTFIQKAAQYFTRGCIRALLPKLD